MGKYLFYPAANKTQDGIWAYGYDVWGEKPAEKYISTLHKHLQALADKELFWHNLPAKAVIPEDLTIKAYFSRYEHHYIFFRELSVGNIGIMSILHERADIPVRLKKDLTLINNKEQ